MTKIFSSALNDKMGRSLNKYCEIHNLSRSSAIRQALNGMLSQDQLMGKEPVPPMQEPEPPADPQPNQVPAPGPEPLLQEPALTPAPDHPPECVSKFIENTVKRVMAQE